MEKSKTFPNGNLGKRGCGNNTLYLLSVICYLLFASPSHYLKRYIRRISNIQSSVITGYVYFRTDN